MGGNQNESQSTGLGNTTSQNIGSALLANLFGQGASFGPSGLLFGQNAPQSAFSNTGTNIGLNPAGTGLVSGDHPGVAFENQADGSFRPAGFDFANPVFGPESFNSLGNITSATPQNIFQTQLPQQTFLEASQLLNPALSEGVGSGFRTDISPIVAAEQNRFANQVVPGIAENFAGLSGFGSDFRNATLGAASDLGVRLGEAQAGLDEAAAGRQIQSLGLAPSILQAPAQGALATLGLGQAIQEDTFQSRPEIQLLRTLTNLFNLAPPSTGGTQINSSSSKGGGGGLLTS